MTRNVSKLIILGFLIAAIVFFFAFDLSQYATLDYIKENQQLLLAYYHAHTALVFASFGVVYVLITAFSLPAATILTLLGGGLFGFWPGLLLVSFASSLGATCAFLMSRFLLKDTLQRKYGVQLKKVNEEFEKEGSFYLFSLRLVPVVPFFLVNLLMGLLPMRTRQFYGVSQLGMLPGTAVYVYAGTALSKITSLSDIASPSLLLAFVLLGLFPIVAKKAVTFL